MDDRAAIAGVSRAAPGVDAEAQPALDGTLAGIAARMPVLLPIDQLRAFLKLRLVDFRTCCVRQVFEEEVQRVHVQLGREIFQRRAGDVAALRMIRSAPRTRTAG